MTPHRRTAQFFYATLILLTGVVFALGVLHHRKATAETGIPFGGYVYDAHLCSCSGNYRISFDNLAQNAPAPGILMFEPGLTILHEFQQIYVPNVWILGNWGGESVCREPCAKGCCITGTYPTMIRVGTSMPGGGAGGVEEDPSVGEADPGAGEIALPEIPTTPACGTPPSGPDCLCPGNVYPNQNANGGWNCP